MREKMEEERLILIDANSSRGLGAITFDEGVFFTLWFYLINIYLSEICIYKNNQNTANKKKIENIDTSRIDTEEKLGKGGADKPGTDRVD